ncbi:MAG TPA: hypothetical protein VGD81_16055, partial [Opitutaceae bacterium]
GCGAAFGASCRRGSSVTFGKNEGICGHIQVRRERRRSKVDHTPEKLWTFSRNRARTVDHHVGEKRG